MEIVIDNPNVFELDSATSPILPLSAYVAAMPMLFPSIPAGNGTNLSGLGITHLDGSLMDAFVLLYIADQGNIALDLSNNALSTTESDAMLAVFATRIVNAPPGGGLIDISGGTNGAPTDGDSNASIITLVAHGCAVTHN